MILTEQQFTDTCKTIDKVFKANENRLEAYRASKVIIDDLHRHGVNDGECARLESYAYTQYTI